MNTTPDTFDKIQQSTSQTVNPPLSTPGYSNNKRKFSEISNFNPNTSDIINSAEKLNSNSKISDREIQLLQILRGLYQRT